MPGGGVRLSGGPILSEAETSNWESEVSSIPDIGDSCRPSESEDELSDKLKYRLPDVGKTRLHLLTKEPLSPSRRAVPSSPRRAPDKMALPTTPRSERATRPLNSPQVFRLRMGSSENIHAANGEDYLGSDISRAGSIYSISRASFAGQIAQLTSIELPDATSLEKRISSIPTAHEAALTLSKASDQIRLWIGKASEVLQGLDAQDDVEWAAAGGRDGIEEADQAINRFEKLVDIYVSSIEKLQTRTDANTLTAAELNGSVKQMETIIASWAKIKSTLKSVKHQVQLAIDYETIWNTDLGEVAQEIGQLRRHIFELEEKRHQGAEQLFATSESVDLNELESILEEQPQRLTLSESPLPRLNSMIDNAESFTLGLSARMQPLRTSLDFLPMKLSTFHIRANATFPTACKELQDRRDELEEQWTRIEADAKSLRDELGDDKWVTVFRNAGSQASKMCASIERTLVKLKAALELNEHVLHRSAAFKKIESYEAKKLHYTPAIDRVLGIIDRGVQDRLTINGDVLRHRTQLQQRWTELRSRTKVMDSLLSELNMVKKDQQLRDSVSTILSSEKSGLSSLLDTPGTSPASSVIGASRKSSFLGSRTPTQAGALNTPSTSSMTSGRLPSSSIPRRSGLFARSSVADFRNSPSPAPSTSAKVQWPSRPLIVDEHRPKWNASTKTDKREFAPLSKFEPSPYAKSGTGQGMQASAAHAAGNRVVSESAKLATGAEDRSHRRSTFLFTQTPDRRTASAMAQHSSVARHAITPSLMGRLGRPSIVARDITDGNDADIDAPARSLQRPVSSLDRLGKRTSTLFQRTKHEPEQVSTGAEKPKWR